ncbi:MAG TPA: GFA family protein [Rhizomicrobium sp.]|jgi:hypothetical protein
MTMTAHTGSCHCGNIAFTFEGSIDQALECNCSICAKKGSLLHFCPEPAFRMTTPEVQMGTYKFNTHRIAHRFCPTCGIAPFALAADKAGNAMVAINLRCVDGVDPDALKIQKFDGRSL